MAKITEFAMANVARRIADSNDTATQLTAKLFAECGVTGFTPETVKGKAWDVCKAFCAWFEAREKCSHNDETDENVALLRAYAGQARTASREWFKLFAVKPGRNPGDEPRAFVGMDGVETGLMGELVGYSRREVGKVDDDKLARVFTKYLILETANLLDGNPWIRLGDEARKEADKAANKKKREKSTQTRETNQEKLDKANDKAEQAEADKAEAEKKLADVVSLVAEAITLVEASHATDIEKAAIIGKLKAAIGK